MNKINLAQKFYSLWKWYVRYNRFVWCYSIREYFHTLKFIRAFCCCCSFHPLYIIIYSHQLCHAKKKCVRKHKEPSCCTHFSLCIHYELCTPNPHWLASPSHRTASHTYPTWMLCCARPSKMRTFLFYCENENLFFFRSFSRLLFSFWISFIWWSQGIVLIRGGTHICTFSIVYLFIAFRGIYITTNSHMPCHAECHVGIINSSHTKYHIYKLWTLHDLHKLIEHSYSIDFNSIHAFFWLLLLLLLLLSYCSNGRMSDDTKFVFDARISMNLLCMMIWFLLFLL